MSFIANALGGNPFATPIGQKIEQATDGSLPSESWELNMEICDLINSSEDGPRDASKAIRKRLQQNAGKNYTVVLYALTVLETCVKNCGKRFHVLVCSKDFVQDLVKLIGPKNDPPTAVQEKVLSMLQAWADAFKGQPDLSGVCQVVSDLRAKGIEFPPTDLDTMAPIHTPQRSVTEPCAEVTVPSSPTSRTTPNRAQVAQALAPEQLAKLQSELDVVQTNAAVLAELLTELTPGKEEPDDLQLLQELHTTCREMQQRLVELIGKIADDRLTAELLRVNDELNNVFLRYARHEKNREVGNKTPSAILAGALGQPPTSDKDQLIDLSDGVETLTVKEAAPEARSPNADEFDMFAQSRNVTYETSKLGGSTYKDNLDPDQVSGGLGSLTQSRAQPPAPAVEVRETDFDEMAAWLDSTPGAAPTTAPEESVTSSEFERFLAERAAAAEALPSQQQPKPQTRPNKRDKPDDDASLFAL